MNPNLIEVPYPENYDRLPMEMKKPYQAKQRLLEELRKFYNEYKNQTVIAALYNLGREGKVFSLEMKKMLRPAVKVECEELCKYNWHWDSAGKLYVFDKEATDKRNIAHKEWLKEKAAKEELQAEVGVALTDAMQSIGKTAKASLKEKAAKEKVKEQVQEPKVKTKDELKKEFLDYVKSNKVGRDELTKMAETNNLPEEEYASMNTIDFVAFVADALCEVPEILKQFVK